MAHEKIVQITATQNDVYGLTETGKLAKLDTNVNQFVFRCPAEILTADRASTLTVFEKHVTPVGKYGPTVESKPIEQKSWWENKEAMIVAIIPIVLSILLAWFLYRH